MKLKNQINQTFYFRNRWQPLKQLMMGCVNVALDRTIAAVY